MILLLDRMSVEANLLRQSLLTSGAIFRAFCFEDDGFLPEGVESPYHYYAGIHDAASAALPVKENGKIEQNLLKRPVYFSRLSVPEGWEICSTGADGNVWDYETKRAEISYSVPKSNRNIQSVTWLDKSGAPCWTEHYDQWGILFARTVIDKKGEGIIRIYYRYDVESKASGERRAFPCIQENLKNHSITLWKSKDGRRKEYIFPGKVEFMVHYLQEIGVDCGRVLFNSLGWSFLAERRLRTKNPGEGRDVLFWQEGIGEQLPGNMTVILNEKKWISHIVVQSAAVYEKIVQLLQKQAANGGLQDTENTMKMFRPLGYIYPMTRNNERKKDVLILTNSDAVEKLQELVEALPEFTFRIGALTEMSKKLLSMEAWDNVSLYHGISEIRAKKLLENCDFYLDINHGSEIVDAVREAYLHRALILGFYETAHNRTFEPEENLFLANNWKLLAEELVKAAESETHMEMLLDRQDVCAMRSNAAEYAAVGIL